MVWARFMRRAQSGCPSVDVLAAGSLGCPLLVNAAAARRNGLITTEPPAPATPARPPLRYAADAPLTIAAPPRPAPASAPPARPAPPAARPAPAATTPPAARPVPIAAPAPSCGPPDTR